MNRGSRWPRSLASAICWAAIGCFVVATRVDAVESSAIEAARIYSEQNGGEAFVVLRLGRVLHESYAGRGGPLRPKRVMSITKSLIAVAGFAAAGEGWLDLDEPVARTITEWTGQRADVTLRQLLNQTSGLASGHSTIYGRAVRDKVAAALRLDVVTTPGTRFDYGAGNYEVFGEVLRRKLAARCRRTVVDYVTEVLRPTGASLGGWDRDRNGEPFYSTGAWLTARDLARFGELVRTRGRAGIWPVIPATAFDTARLGSAANSMYGLSFWLNRNAQRSDAEPISVEGTLGDELAPDQWARSSLSATAPSDLIAMIGSGGLRCYILPAEKMVLVRFGNGHGFSDAEFLAKFFANQ
ncbi:MAG: serine hydrolase domain-containing protein [Chthoniobacterales bacterium]